MVLEVYLDPITSNCRKVLAGLDLLGTEYTLHKVNYFTGGHKEPEYTKNINPFATIPAARDGDLQLTESNSILQYAADLNGESPAYPRDLKTRANINRWLFWEASAWFHACYPFLDNMVREMHHQPTDEKALEQAAIQFHKGATILEDLFSKSKFIVGDAVTIADISIMAVMHVHEAQRLPLEGYPNFRRWIADIEALPSWRKTQGAIDAALSPNKEARHVRASLNYTKDPGDKLAELYLYETEKAKTAQLPVFDTQEMPVYDGWHRAGDFSVDKEGFSLHNFRSAVPREKFQEDEFVKEHFYPEIVEFLKKQTGAKRVVVFDHTIRSRANEKKELTDESNPSQRAPVLGVHCDYTAESGPLRLKQLLPDEADDLLSRRVAFFNVWKPLATVEEMPLAMCDITSSDPEDFFKLYMRYRDRTGENYVMKHSDKHKWWYFPGITAEQCIILKTYESDESRARFLGHSAFKDPTSKEDAPFRESVEIRTIAFF